jgi:uncharacterized protein YceH (UPF0502 family)
MSSEPVNTFAETIERSASLNRLLSAPLSRGSKMPTALTLAERIRRVREAHASHLAASEARLEARLKSVADRADQAIKKMDEKLESDVAVHEAEVVALEDELNQMTNGGPALSDSSDEK